MAYTYGGESLTYTDNGSIYYGDKKIGERARESAPTQNIHGVDVPYGTELTMNNFKDYVAMQMSYQGMASPPKVLPFDRGSRKATDHLPNATLEYQRNILLRLRQETKDFIGDRKLK
jgi:hypothetical protein